MTRDNIVKADNWCRKHNEHIARLVKGVIYSYEPPNEDAGHPELWRAPHWRWFLSNA